MIFISIISTGQIHSIITLAWGMICLLMGINLLAFNIPEKKIVQSYRTSVKVLAANYLVLSVVIFCMVLFGLRNSPDDIFPFPVLLLNLSQGIIFPYTLISLYSPNNSAFKRIIFFNIILLIILIIIYLTFAVIFGDPLSNSLPFFFSHLLHPTILIRFLLLLFSLFQIAFYIFQVQKMSLHYIKHMNEYYSDTIQLKPQWARKNFYFAATIAMLSVVASLFKDVIYDTVFTVIFGFFYYLFALRYMRYESIFFKLEPKFIEDLNPASKAEYVFSEDKKKRFSWENARTQIIEQQLYLHPGITVNDMAELFRTNRTTFSAALNKNEKLSFNSFINRLRIEHAKQLLIDKPELSIVQIAEQCGYSEQSNFTRHFKQYCDQTPAVWSKNFRKRN
ncbi:MAG: AraC family transcriptional regulator [Sphingobacteriia bacterium]|nr:AraC family transcriptional regulator [Sphingobacteriia bacterium]